MLPEWMKERESFEPPNDSSEFVISSIKAIGSAMSRIRVQRGQDKGLPPLLKLFLLIGFILLVSAAQSRLLVMSAAALLLLYLAASSAEDILIIIKSGLAASALAFFILLPAVITGRAGIKNESAIVCKVFISVSAVSIFSHTTQWNHITGALRKIHIPGIFIFTLDITLKYIVLLGNLITELLTSMQLRAVGKNNSKYNSIGGVMGSALIIGAALNRQMYEAMQCRGFTDDYEGL